VQGHRDQLGVVLENLVENGFRHGGRHVVVTLFDRGFDVADDGPGISEANRAQVFDRFFTTDRAHGTGLGLALVRAIVLRHGGTVGVSSTPGNTVFSVRL
jgi:signal transduction histidine kinase